MGRDPRARLGTRALEAGPDGLEVIAIGEPQADDTEMEQGWW